MNVLVLSDGKPGHLTISYGVVESLKKIRYIEHTTLEISLRIKLFRYLLRFGLNHQSLIQWIPFRIQYSLISFCYKVKSTETLSSAIARADWIISSGGDTSFMNAWITNTYKVNNIYCSSLRGLNPNLFTILVSTTSKSARSNEIKMWISPVPIDREHINEQGRQFRKAQNLNEGSVWAILIGGNGGGYRFNQVAMENLADGIVALANQHHAQLLITTSRRTGLKLEKILARCFSNQSVVKYTTYYNHSPEKVVSNFLGAAEVVFCTAESGSMITEAIAAGKPVYALEPDHIKTQQFYESFLGDLEGSKYLKRVNIKELNYINVNYDQADYFRMLEKDPVSELSDKIKYLL